MDVSLPNDGEDSVFSTSQNAPIRFRYYGFVTGVKLLTLYDAN